MSKTPAKVWQQMVRGNERFVSGKPLHPRQDVERRAELASSQAPDAALFGCSDSRLAAEIIFDKGLGDLFVVRNAGQIVSASVVASLEYAVEVLGVPLIVVLAHDSCGAVQAAIDTQREDAPPLPPHIATHIAPILPAVHTATQDGVRADATEVGRVHLRNTVRGLVEASELISDAIAEGRLAVVGANYRLSEGRAAPDVVIGSV
ncbi:carbonic anhydrase [Lysobacter korlensis]|uniref:carbonic anhydrase n=1 Tax=Lysobacter korlensis TaxID=553636 RepID=A0ABV6RZB2_9GAMM